MVSVPHPSQHIDARQLILDADFDNLAVSEPTMLEVARQWTVQVSTWLSGHEQSRPRR